MKRSTAIVVIWALALACISFFVIAGCSADLGPAPPAGSSDEPGTGSSQQAYHIAIAPCFYTDPNNNNDVIVPSAWLGPMSDGTWYFFRAAYQLMWTGEKELIDITSQYVANPNASGWQGATNCWDKFPTQIDPDTTHAGYPPAYYIGYPNWDTNLGYWRAIAWDYVDLYSTWCGSPLKPCVRFKAASTWSGSSAGYGTHSWITTDAYHWTQEY
jgi:hypothetical protein